MEIGLRKRLREKGEEGGRDWTVNDYFSACVCSCYRLIPNQTVLFLCWHTQSQINTHTLVTSIWVCFWPVLGGAWQKKLSLTTMASVSAAGESRLPTHTWPVPLSFTERPAASLRMSRCLCRCPPPPASSRLPCIAKHSMCLRPCFPLEQQPGAQRLGCFKYS